MSYIACLLDNPGKDISILKLMESIEGTGHTSSEYDKMADEQLNDIGMRNIDKPVTDKHNYKNMKEAQGLLADLKKAKENL